MAAVLVSPVGSSDIIEETEKDVSPVPGSVPIPSSSSTEQAVSGTLQNPILFLGFNQDSGRFACGTHSGFRVYDCHPFREAITREFSDDEESGIGSVAFIELLFRSNIMAIVGGGPSPKYPPNKVMIWDDQQCRCIGELSFRSEVRAVKLRRDRIVVILEHKVYVYNFADLKLLLQIDTISNKKGLCAISSTSNSIVLACPGITKGQLRVEFNGTKKTKFIPAHDSGLACISLTLDGQLVATASNKGTLIRVFNTHDCTQLQEVRRGVDRADIYSISFSGNAQFLAVSSDKGTVHVFRLKGEIENSNPSNTNSASTLSFMKGVLPKYFSSEWSLCQFRLPDEVKSFVAFGPEKQTLIIVGSDGSFYRCLFDNAHGGEMVQQEYEKFL